VRRPQLLGAFGGEVRLDLGQPQLGLAVALPEQLGELLGGELGVEGTADPARLQRTEALIGRNVAFSWASKVVGGVRLASTTRGSG
jgi:hypothetical protein